MSFLKDLTTSELCAFLRKNVLSLSESVVFEISSQRIDKEALFQMTEMSEDDRYLREIAPLLGDRIKLRVAISKYTDEPVRNMHNTAFTPLCMYLGVS